MEVIEMSDFYFENDESFEYLDNLQLKEHLSGLEFFVSEEEYLEIFKYFKEKDMIGLAGVIKRFAERLSKSQSLEVQIKSLNDEISNLNIKLSDQDRELTKLSESNGDLQAEANSLREEVFKSEKVRCESMRDLYMCGYSLRQIGKMLHCDKSTVKRKLLKMGVQIRK